MEIKSPPSSYFLKQAAGIEKGATLPGKDGVGTVSVRQLYDIGKIKQTDSNMQDRSLETIVKSLAASCKSIGIKVSF